jgi:hypothetical protein
MSGPTPGRKAGGLYGGINISSNEPSVPSLTALQQTEIPATSSAPTSLTITGSTGTVQNEEEGTSGVALAPTPAPGEYFNLTSSTLAHRVLKAVSRCAPRPRGCSVPSNQSSVVSRTRLRTRSSQSKAKVHYKRCSSSTPRGIRIRHGVSDRCDFSTSNTQPRSDCICSVGGLGGTAATAAERSKRPTDRVGPKRPEDEAPLNDPRSGRQWLQSSLRIPQNEVFQASWKRRRRWWKEGSAFVSIGVHTESFSPRHSVIHGNQSRNLSTLSLPTIHSVPCILQSGSGSRFRLCRFSLM